MKSFIVVVHRYDQPHDRFGLHTNIPYPGLRQGVYWVLGLFSQENLNKYLEEKNLDLEPSELPLQDLINCAPIEWHSAMREGNMLERFQVFSINPETVTDTLCFQLQQGT